MTGKGGLNERKGGLNDLKGGPQSPPQNRKTEEKDRTDRQRGSKSTEATKADPLVSGGTEDEWQMFVDWVFSHNMGSLRAAQAAKVYRRAGRKRLARLDEWFAVLDEIAGCYPVLDEHLDPHDRETVAMAEHEWVNGNVTVFGLWALMSMNGYRECAWVTFED